MNYMEQVAQMLGMEIGEEFEISDCPGKFRFTPTNFQYWSDRETWENSSAYSCLLEGDWEIVNKPWGLEFNGDYWYCGKTRLMHKRWIDDSWDVAFYRLGNCYKTKNAAAADREKWERFFSCTDRIEWEAKDNA